ncbi:uncharacterized protein RHO25_002461 [Cercospora beticola]|nr:hypothetical protein RHO25_002461 [Cercospora beticola]CAK1359047.1 unnamed protein product [Cercospora beticola]
MSHEHFEQARSSSPFSPLPQELIELIIEHISVNDLCGLRSVDQELFQRTQRTFVRRAFNNMGVLVCDEEGLQMACNVASHPVYRDAIHHVSIYMDQCCECEPDSIPLKPALTGPVLPDPAQFERCLRQQNMRSSGVDLELLTKLLSLLKVRGKLKSITVRTESFTTRPRPILGSEFAGTNPTDESVFNSRQCYRGSTTEQGPLWCIGVTLRALLGSKVFEVAELGLLGPLRGEILTVQTIFPLFKKLLETLPKLRIDAAREASRWGRPQWNMHDVVTILGTALQLECLHVDAWTPCYRKPVQWFVGTLLLNKLPSSKTSFLRKVKWTSLTLQPY